jgi:hypothetical protein
LGFPNPTISRTFFSRAFSSSCWTSGVCEAQVWWLFFPLACRLLGAPSSYWSGFGASKLETRIRWRLLIVAWLFFFCLRLLCCSQAFFYYDVALLFDGWACRLIMFGNVIVVVFLKILKYFFLLKFNMVYIFWIVFDVLMSKIIFKK